MCKVILVKVDLGVMAMKYSTLYKNPELKQFSFINGTQKVI